jgi:DNA-binding transcriptional regulator GbsR (MarR family)
MSDGGPDRSSGSGASAATERVLEWLGEVGARWGLPADACRVHGWLYLSAGKSTEAEIAEAVALSLAQTRSALAWLGDHRLVDAGPGDRWQTGDDPWALVMRALERRRDQELPVALEVLRTTHRQAASDARLANRIGSLLAMVDDVAAIDAQAQRLSPQSLRRLIRAGGTVARLVNPLLGPKKRAAP